MLSALYMYNMQLYFAIHYVKNNVLHVFFSQLAQPALAIVNKLWCNASFNIRNPCDIYLERGLGASRGERRTKHQLC
jgi:hypothetical protein